MNPLEQFSDALETLVEQTSPAVVGVEEGAGPGAGMVITPDGYVLTNRHVVGRARRVLVRFSDGYDRRAQVVGVDAPTDLAVLKVDGPGLACLSLAEAQAPRVGTVVMAVGNPYGLERSVSMGIVSALDRTLPGARGGQPLEGLIQTDAAINPGNSGGPLMDVRGRVLGINTAIIPFGQGLGFAVPATTAAWVVGLLIQHGSIERPRLGVVARAESLAPTLHTHAPHRKGVRVLEVALGTAAAHAGISAGDIITHVNGAPVSNVGDIQKHLVLARGARVEATLLRRLEKRTVQVTPQEQLRV